MKEKLEISLLGCGWLGFPLAINLISKAYTLKASTTTLEKLPIFESAGINPYLIQFDSGQEPDLTDFLQSDILIISIPPGRKSIDGLANYRKMAQVLCKQLATSPISKVIFISSTSVYPESNEILNEFSEIAPETESGLVLAETEALFLALKKQVILLRLAGLFGPNRMPGKFFAGRENIPNGLAPVNMIHLDDAVSLINCLIDSESAKGVYIGCSPSHPTKEEFYNLAAKVEKLVAPQFIPEKTKWKIISSDRTIQELNFQYKYNSLMDCLNETDYKS